MMRCQVFRPKRVASGAFSRLEGVGVVRVILEGRTANRAGFRGEAQAGHHARVGAIVGLSTLPLDGCQDPIDVDRLGGAVPGGQRTLRDELQLGRGQVVAWIEAWIVYGDPLGHKVRGADGTVDATVWPGQVAGPLVLFHQLSTLAPLTEALVHQDDQLHEQQQAEQYGQPVCGDL